mmetsp:Transcript_16750/g.31729  ORF Transcript_16750/g.31729 Transcript_16750/m.31729 type:complete len:146 (+) Transcript_16750:325-762(+)
MPPLFRSIRCCGKKSDVVAIANNASAKADLLQNSTGTSRKEDDRSPIPVIYIRHTAGLLKDTAEIAQDYPTTGVNHDNHEAAADDDDMSVLTIGSLRDLYDKVSNNRRLSVAPSSNAAIPVTKPTVSWKSSMTCRDDEEYSEYSA